MDRQDYEKCSDWKLDLVAKLKRKLKKKHLSLSTCGDYVSSKGDKLVQMSQ